MSREQERVLCESRGAVLTLDANGAMRCRCPFACLAACEPCEFTGSCGHDHRKGTAR